MSKMLPTVFASLFLSLAFLFGGAASAGVYGNAAIQLAAALIIAFAIADRKDQPVGLPTGFIAILCGIIALAVFQLVPLPPALWSLLPGHGLVRDGAALTNVPAGWRPISLAPMQTLGSALAVLPVIAAAILGARLPRTGLIAAFVIVVMFMVVSVGFALAQRVTGLDSPFYFYQITNRGLGVGLFANANHLATLCAVSIPIATALFVMRRGSTKPNASWLLLIMLIVVALVGIVLANSGAGLGLAVLAAGSFVALTRLRRGGIKLGTGKALAILGALAVVVLVGLWFGLGYVSRTKFAADTDMGRAQLWLHTLRAILSFAPFGSGLGSFPIVYPQFEDSQVVTQIFANHAHNDILEAVMTGGVFALFFLVFFMAWFAKSAIIIWKSKRNPFSEAATLTTTLILLHEAVDYPLRTAAVATLFGLCCGIIMRPQRSSEPAKDTERPGRHMAA